MYPMTQSPSSACAESTKFWIESIASAPRSAPGMPSQRAASDLMLKPRVSKR